MSSKRFAYLLDVHDDRCSLTRRRERAQTGEERDTLLRDLDNHLEAGFQLATFQGPLCAEPVEGLAYFVESVEVDREGIEQERRRSRPACSYGLPTDRLTEHNRMAQVTGAFITSVREACRNGLLDWSPRLMLAMYTCDIQASSALLGIVVRAAWH